MTFKPVGIDEDSLFPPRVETRLSGTFAGLGALGPRAKVPATRTPITYIIDMGRTDHGAVASSGAVSSNLADTADFMRGIQSCSVTSGGVGATAGIRRVGFTAMNLTGKKFEVSVKVSDWSKLRQLAVYLGDSAFANYHVFTVYDSTDRSQTIIQPTSSNEWITFTFDMTSKTGTVGAPDMTAIRGAQVAFIDDNTGTPITGHANHLACYTASPLFPNGVVSFTFDDSFLSQYTVAQPKLNQYGFQGTFYTIVDILGGTMNSVPYYMTATHLKKLQDSGHEIGAHAFTTAAHNRAGGYTTLTPDELDYELRSTKDWLIRHGFLGADHLALPQGLTNAAVDAAVKTYFSSQRGTLRKPYDTLKPGPCRNLHSGDIRPNAALDTADIDAAYSNGTWLNFRVHDIVATVPTPPGTPLVQTSTSQFNAIVDYVATKGIPVRTVGDVLGTA